MLSHASWNPPGYWNSSCGDHQWAPCCQSQWSSVIFHLTWFISSSWQSQSKIWKFFSFFCFLGHYSINSPPLSLINPSQFPLLPFLLSLVSKWFQHPRGSFSWPPFSLHFSWSHLIIKTTRKPIHVLYANNFQMPMSCPIISPEFQTSISKTVWMRKKHSNLIWSKQNSWYTNPTTNLIFIQSSPSQ